MKTPDTVPPIATPVMAATLLLLAALLFLSALNSYQLRGSTEPRVAGIAAAVLIDNDWVTPKLNGSPFLEKPPLSIWLDATAIKVFGATPLAVRLTSALAAIATAMLLFWQLIRLQKSTTTAWFAGLLLITMAEFWSNGRQVGEDALLTLGITLCLLTFLQAQQRALNDTWPLFSIGIAIATLSKGLLGLVLPGAVIFTYLLCCTLLDRRVQPMQWLRPASAALLGLIPLTIWLWLLYQRNGSGAVAEILWANSVGRFDGDFANNGHFAPAYYYLTKLPQLFLPWNILVFLGLWQYLKKSHRDRDALFFSCWLIAPFVLLSFASGKRMVYLLALYPAAAVIAADYGMQCLIYFNKTALTSKLAQWLHRYRHWIMLGVLFAISIGYLYRVAIWEPKQDRKQSFLPIAQQLIELQHRGHRVALYQPSERLAGAAVFYSGHILPQLQSSAELYEFLTVDRDNIAIVQADAAPSMDLRVLYRVREDKLNYLFVTHE